MQSKSGRGNEAEVNDHHHDAGGQMYAEPWWKKNNSFGVERPSLVQSKSSSLDCPEEDGSESNGVHSAASEDDGAWKDSQPATSSPSGFSSSWSSALSF